MDNITNGKTKDYEIPKTLGNWKRVTLIKGFPSRFDGALYYAPVIYMSETSSNRITSAQKDPRAKTRKGYDDEIAGRIILASCILVRAKDLISVETADERLEAFDNEDMTTYEASTLKSVFPLNESEWYVMSEDLDSSNIVMGDSRRISQAFKAINRLQEEELSSFFG
jgi:hypothetical protein